MASRVRSYSNALRARRSAPLQAPKIWIRGVANGVTRDLMTGELTSLPDIEV